MALVDYTKRYRIEALPSKRVKELAEMGVGSFNGTTRISKPAYHRLMKKTVETGLDENDQYILNLPEDKRIELQTKIVERRKALEKKLGVPDSLLPTSDIWQDEPLTMCEIKIEGDFSINVNNSGSNILDPKRSLRDELCLQILLNKKDFPKGLEEAKKMPDAIFYLTDDDAVVSAKRESSMSKMKAYKLWYEMLESKDKKRMIYIATYLDVISPLSAYTESLANSFEGWIGFEEKTGSNVDKFLQACEVDEQKIKAVGILKKAYGLGLIARATNGNLSRGRVEYRQSYDTSAEFLLSVGQEVEYSELYNEVAKRSKDFFK